MRPIVQLWVNDTTQPFGFAKMQGPQSLMLSWRSFLGSGNKCVMCLFRYNANQWIKNATIQPFQCWVCKTKNPWPSVDVHINQMEPEFVHALIVCNELYTHHWHSSLRFWVLSFASRSFVTCQFLSNLYPRYLGKNWHDSIAFLRLRPAIYGM